MKIHWLKAGKDVRVALLAVFFIGLTACSSPAEKAEKYYERGLALMEQGDLLKARIELQNALQIRPDLTAAWFALAQIAEQQGDWEKLFGLLNKVADYDPQHLETQIKLGRMLLAAGRLDRALAASDFTLGLAPNNAEVLGLRAGVLYKLDDKAGAVAQANAALKISPNNIDALVVLATERLAANDAEKAIEYLDRGLKVNDKNIALQLIKVQALESMAQTDSSEAIFRKLIALYPETRALRHTLAEFYLVHGRADAAEAEYRSIAAENPDDVEASLDVVRFIGTIKGREAALQYLQDMIAADTGNNELSFALAAMQQSQGDQRAAEAVFRTIIARSGDTPDAIKAKGLLAGILLLNGDKPAAQTLINEVLAGDQRNEQGLLLKAGLAVDGRQYDQAIADLRSILRDSPNSPRALLMLAKTHELAGAPELAQENYLKAYEVGKPVVQFGMAYAEFLLQRGQMARAEIVASEVLLAEPDHVPAMRVLAQARINQGNWAGAQAVADQMSQLSGQGLVADEIRGTIFAARKDYSESIAAFRRVYDAAPAEVQPMVALVRSYLLAGRVSEAVDFLRSVIQASPSSASALLLLGELHVVNKDDAAATEVFQQVIDLLPEQAAGYINLANVNMRAGRIPEAEQVIERGLAKSPGNFELLMAQAGIFEVSGRFDEAITAYEALHKDYPGSDIAVNNLASLLSEHRSEQASWVRAYELALRFRRSDVPYFKDTLGWASYRLGKVEEGTLLIKDAARQLPEQPVFRYHLGMSYAALDKKEQAREELEKALELSQVNSFHDVERIREALEKL
ncbi:tetratricopeptide repeat protein [Pseudomonas sp.]|uniref:tetratricopeptide repeat protein n=1 Tax=Pseudomonas sp. TaxID=306 RepID=UPI00299D29D6|nr:tetratricopeptide repeat protein [Pseudomonas sp.]MDX1365992.1 tetratricopeptide repeat protein [Pseudomonas sp.]